MCTESAENIFIKIKKMILPAVLMALAVVFAYTFSVNDPSHAMADEIHAQTALTGSPETTGTAAGISSDDTSSAAENASAEDSEKDDEENETDISTPAAAASSSKSGSKKQKRFIKRNLRLMSAIIYSEAGCETYQGQLAVGIVIMNRMRSDLFPNTIKGVIYQKGQFQPTRNGSLNRHFSEYDSGKTNTPQWKSCIKAAKSVMNGRTYIYHKGKKKSLKSYYFFSVKLSGYRLQIDHQQFK